MFHIMLNKINKLSYVLWKAGDTIWAWIFVAEHDQAFVGRQDCNSAGKTAIRDLCSDRKNIMYKNASKFDCNLTNIKLYLKSEFYPYDETRFRQR